MGRKAITLNIDDLTDGYSSLSKGRQLTRASILGGVTSAVLGPLFIYFHVAITFEQLRVTRGPPETSFGTILYIFPLISLVSLPLGLYIYVRMYRGSKRLFTVMKSSLRIVVFSLYGYFIIPAIMIFYVWREPLIILYVASLVVSVLIMLSFARLYKKWILDMDRAYRSFSSPELFYSPGGGNTVSFMLREIFTIPPGYLIGKRRMALVLFLSVLALLLEGLSVCYIFQQNQNLMMAARVDLPNISTLTNNTIESRVEIIGISVATLIFPLLAIPIFALAGRVRRAARRAAIHSMTEVRTKDTRAPLLFLRSFYDDQVGLPSDRASNIFERVLVRASLFANVDEMLTEKYWHVGPVFAIGKPGDSLPPLGAARAYLAGERWQTVVGTLMKEARAIILGLDHTEGVLWELRHGLEAGCLKKMLLLVPPHRRDDTQLLLAVLPILGLSDERLDSTAAGSVIAFLPISNEQVVVFYANRADSYTYDLVLRLGLHAILESARPHLIGETVSSAGRS